MTAITSPASSYAEDPVRPAPQAEIRWLQPVPAGPLDLQIPDWREIAVTFDRVVFDFEREGKHFPIIWRDPSKRNYPQETIGMQSYFGDTRQQWNSQEGIVVIGSVLGGVLAGVDKRSQDGRDYVGKMLNFHNRDNGRDVVLNRTDTPNSSFWYDLYPAVLFFGIADRFPDDEQLSAVVRAQADQVTRAVEVINGKYDVTAYDFLKHQPIVNGRWIEPDGSAGLAWLAYAGYQRFGDDRYLQAARAGYRAFEAREGNPHYEVMGPFGALLGARLAAEQGDSVDIGKVLAWAFEPDSAARRGWGMIFGEWGGYEVNGLHGSAADGGGFAFAMNTFNHAIPLAPLPRYDPRFARDIGKWLLHAFNNARLYYPDALPPELQTGYEWREATEGGIPYEAIRRDWGGLSPYAMGDPLVHGWAPTDYGIYSGMLAGVFAAIGNRTSDPAILEIDTLATDFFRPDAYPTFLYYNPATETRRFAVDVGDTAVDLYDSVSKQVILRNVRGETELRLGAGGAAVIARIPAGLELRREGRRLIADGIVVDYDLAPEAILTEPYRDEARVLRVPRATPRIDGQTRDWNRLARTADPVQLRTPEGAEVEFRFAWDDRYLYALVREKSAGVPPREAANPEVYRRSPWEHDGISLYFDLANDNRGERYWEVAVRAGFSSDSLEEAIVDQIYRTGPNVPRGLRETRAAARGPHGERVIEMAVAWSDLRRLVPEDRRGGWTEGAPPRGFRFGCEPSVLLNSWRAEYWLSGTRAPAGDDPFSIDLELK